MLYGAEHEYKHIVIGEGGARVVVRRSLLVRYKVAYKCAYRLPYCLLV